MKMLSLRLLALALAWPAVSAPAAQLLESGSFEAPRVKDRLPRIKGGSPLRSGRADWIQFDDKKGTENGTLTAGITNEIGRSGKQSIYVDFQQITTEKAAVVLASDFISIQPDKPYRVSIWGRLPRKNALTIDQRQAYLKLFVEFYQKDRETPCEEGETTAARLQPIPGSPNRPPLFVNSRWSEFYADLESPKDAGFVRITWRFESPDLPGDTKGTTGTIFFDDATLLGEPGPVVEEKEPLDPLKMNDDGEFVTDPAVPGAAPAPGTAPEAAAPSAPAAEASAPKATPEAKKKP